MIVVIAAYKKSYEDAKNKAGDVGVTRGLRLNGLCKWLGMHIHLSP